MLAVDDDAWRLIKHRGLVMHMTIQEVRHVLKYGHAVRGTDELAQIYTAGTRTILIGAEEFRINTGPEKDFEVELSVTMLKVRRSQYRADTSDVLSGELLSLTGSPRRIGTSGGGHLPRDAE